MPVTNFDDPEVTVDGVLRVRGTFTPYENEELDDEVYIRFLLSQQDAGNPTGPWLTLSSTVTWTARPVDNVWFADFGSNTPLSDGFRTVSQFTNGEARMIGIAVFLKPQPNNDPPAFETFTWCVRVNVKAD